MTPSPADPAAWAGLAGLPGLAGLAAHPVFGVAATVFGYRLGLFLFHATGRHPLAHPTLVAVVAIASVLLATGLPYADYMRGAALIHFLLGPAVVLLAVPLFRQTALIRASGGVIAAGLAVGTPAGAATGVGLGWLLGARPETLVSLAPKSATAGIAVGVSEAIGGIPELTAVLVIMTGIAGAAAGPTVATLVGARDPRAVGLALGVAAHGLGAARALQIGEVAGAFASLGMGLNGIATAVLLPLMATLLR